MLLAGVLFACMGVFVKLGAAHFSHIELVFYRSFFGLLLVYAILKKNRTPLATPHWRPHLWRGLSGTVALALFFYCIAHLPLATAITLNYTAPLFLTILTMLVFKDRLHAPLTAAILLGFAGVVMVLHPTLARDQLITGLLGLTSGFLAGVAYLNVKQLGLIGEPPTRVVFYFTLIATVASGLWMLAGEVHAITAKNLALLIGLGSTATLAQLAMTQAYRVGNTLVVGSMAYSTIVFASLFGMLLWNEVPTASSWMGIALIVASGMLSLRLSPKH